MITGRRDKSAYKVIITQRERLFLLLVIAIACAYL